MPLLLMPLARRASCLLAIVLAILGFSSFAANAGISSGLRNLLQGALGTDLRIDSFVLDKSEASVGATLRATVGISNNGKAAAASTFLTFWATPDSATSTSNAYRLATARLGTLQPTARITYVSTFPVPNFGRPGRYRILVTVESSSTEVNRQNNTQAKSLQVLGPSFSDADPTPVSETDPPPASDPDTSSSPPPASTPVAGGGSSSPPPSSPSSPPAVSTPSSPPAPALPSPPQPPPSNSDPVAPPPPPTSGEGSTPPPEVHCDYYASPNGGGNGLTERTPFKIQRFWAVATPGRVLCLLDGLYQGSDNMIDPPSGMSGTSGARITVRALNDGRAMVDGQFARTALSFTGNNWWIIEGLNFKNAPSMRSVLRVHSSRNNVFRRLVAWDSGMPSGTVFVLTHGSSDNLLEDVAVFGTGRKQVLLIGDSNRNILRRLWTRWEGYIASGGPVSTSIVYGSYNNTCENCLATWSGESMPEEYDLHSHTSGHIIGPRMTNFQISTTPAGALGIDHMNNVSDKCTNSRYLGSIAYIKATDRLPRQQSSGSVTGQAVNVASLTCFEIKHTLAVISARNPDFNSTFKAWNLMNHSQGAGSFSARNISSIRGSGSRDSIASQWDVHNFSAGTSPSAVANPWTAPLNGPGANLCNKWINGVRTNEPLWPWPMNQRIKEATASAGAYNGPCPTCVGGRFRRTATDVTADIEALLGPIPLTCRR